MRLQYYVTCLWPGLAEVWWRGRLSALPTAFAFAAALNMMLVMRWLYPEWLSATLVRVACWIGMIAWLLAVVRGIKELPGLISPRTVSEEPDHWSDAVVAYLRGEWREAEGLLTDVLAIEPRDPPALLILAAVYRHTERFEAAEELLRQISRLEAADAWWLERDAELRRLQRDQKAAEEASAEGSLEPEAGESDECEGADKQPDLAADAGAQSASSSTVTDAEVSVAAPSSESNVSSAKASVTG